MSTLSYIKNFLKDPKVASITPSSRFTVQKLSQYIDFREKIRILEFGPADGVYTRFFLEKMTDDSEVAAIETNGDFVNALNKLDDIRLKVFMESAEKAGEIASHLDWQEVDYIVSGIPFSFLDDDVKHDILEQSSTILKKGGAFLGYQTSGHLKPYLKQHFPKVTTEMEYRNIPPMCIYIARK
ncbi:class I SAM-dependent methyltransferase [Natronogracilivirga saccharolytica]|uniref:Phospholipid N-methyltransferase n=1 Tax=Natronogracilivirga saccharolytica TaxID=2812953 RepID=A0A8J7RGR4_9BACT|nr:hypothetical protein [Natronogracilivirga saccharolytica]MBP3191575.1 hypothetical protein [Natronogracilivirga saccharolytica]